MSPFELFSLHTNRITNSPVHWNDKFPSAGNELMRDITKEHVCRRENEQRTKKKIKSSYVPLSSEMTFFFVSLSPLLIVFQFQNTRSAFSLELHQFTSNVLTRENPVIIYDGLEIVFCLFLDLSCCCFFFFSIVALEMIPQRRIPFHRLA